MITAKQQSMLAWIVLFLSFNTQTAQQELQPMYLEKIESLKTLKQQLANPAREQAICNLQTQAAKKLRSSKYSLVGLIISLSGIALCSSTFHSTVQDRISQGKPSLQLGVRPKLPPPTNQEIGSFFAGLACASSALYMLKNCIGSLLQCIKKRFTIHSIKTACPATLVQCKIDLLEQLQSAGFCFSTLEHLVNRTAETCNWPPRRKAVALALASTTLDADFTSMHRAIAQAKARETAS